MNTTKEEHWTNTVIVGCGLLTDFKILYDELNAVKGQFVTASQLFPTAVKEEHLTYEWCVYVKIAPKPPQPKPVEVIL